MFSRLNIILLLFTSWQLRIPPTSRRTVEIFLVENSFFFFLFVTRKDWLYVVISVRRRNRLSFEVETFGVNRCQRHL